MGDSPGGRRRPSIHITPARASRLYGLVRYLEDGPRRRDEVLKHCGIGLRTFYRELELLRKCGVKIRHKDKLYSLATGDKDPAGRLPFPDPLLSFAEMAELARTDSPAGRRLADLLASVIQPKTKGTAKSKRRTRKS